MNFIVFVSCAVICVVLGKPLQITEIEPNLEVGNTHRLSKRFVNPSMTAGGFSKNDFSKIRAKRNAEEECEKLELCKLHARSNHNFMAAFELYFINKENARLWDHRAHSLADCDQRYNCDR